MSTEVAEVAPDTRGTIVKHTEDNELVRPRRRFKKHTIMKRSINKIQSEREFNAPQKPINRLIDSICARILSEYQNLPQTVMFATGVKETISYAACQYGVFRMREAGKQASYSGTKSRKTVTVRDIRMYDIMEKMNAQ